MGRTSRRARAPELDLAESISRDAVTEPRACVCRSVPRAAAAAGDESAGCRGLAPWSLSAAGRR